MRRGEQVLQGAGRGWRADGGRVGGRTCRFNSQCGQNHSPFGATSSGGVKQKVWYACLHCSPFTTPSHRSIRIAPSRRPHFLHAASSSSLFTHVRDLAQCAPDRGDPRRSRWPRRILGFPDDALTSVEGDPIAVGLERWPARVVLMPSLDTKFHLLTNRPSSSRQNVGQRLLQRFLSTWGCPS